MEAGVWLYQSNWGTNRDWRLGVSHTEGRRGAGPYCVIPTAGSEGGGLWLRQSHRRCHRGGPWRCRPHRGRGRSVSLTQRVVRGAGLRLRHSHGRCDGAGVWESVTVEV